ELRRAELRGAIPCVSGLEIFDSTDTEGLEHIRAVFRAHPTAIFIRTSPEFRPPLEPGYLSFTIPPLSESQRYEFWQNALERHGLKARRADLLASRFRIGPGTVESVIAAVERRLDEDQSDEDQSERLDVAARQHIETRMGNVATHITRLARWEQVALPDDVLDSVREFIGRVNHRRTVYDSWGFDARMSTSRGLTALFYGPPGTGKSMVAGLIARELNLDLYRVDLARITSKWIGETEKNLAEVFDAGEDGQCVILFDEADSLFAKRTEVKSSVDRYANLEGSIDNAFKRRMSLRLAFPFPDEEMRVRLWTAHLPPEAPTSGEFDFADLAKKFPMSGGYIRNSAIRAAFLAAQENASMTQDHLVRAIHLEYREMGKLSPGGRME
ncbi:MAG: ATP-binding protein, partial [Myxococcota bacterium]